MKALLFVANMVFGASAFANIVGVGPQNFNPTTDGLDFVTVQSSQTLNPGIINLGLFVNDAFNTLPYLDTSTQSRTKFNDSLVEADFGFGIGLGGGLEAGLTLPVILAQTVNDNGALHGDFAQTGLTEIRPNLKYQFWGQSRYGLALVGSMNFDQTQNDPYAGSGGGPTTNLELAGHATVSSVVLGANFGRRFRQAGTPIFNSVITPLSDQWIASIAASYLIAKLDTKLIGEVYGAEPALPTNSGNDLRNLTSLEMLLGAKHDFTNQISAHAGLGTGLIQGVSTPDWRIYIGLNYELGPLWHREPAVERIPPPVPEPAPEAPAPPPAEEKEQAFRLSNITFDTNSDELSAEAKTALAPIIEQIAKVPFKHLFIEGHTDSVGRAAYNKDLSQRRANSVRNYLLQETKMQASKAEAAGFGADRPIADNGNYQGRQANRRVEFRFER